MRPKVVFFTTGMTAGGAERVIATLANEIAQRGLDVVIAMLKGADSAYPLGPGVKLCSANLEPGLRNLPKAIGFYRRLVNQECPDVIASFSTKSDLIALLSKTLFRTTGRLIVSDRADPYTRNRPMQHACNVLYPRSDALVCQSQSVASYYSEKCKRAAISVIANPLNPESIGEPAPEGRAPTVITVGRLSDQKNHRLAIGAFQKIRKAFPDHAFKIFGAGPLEAELKDLVYAANLVGSVTFEGIVPNVIHRNENASLFLFTSTHEGYPNALMEAAATGIPAVTTDFSPGTAREIIDSGVNGYIVPSGDQDALAEAAIKVLSGELDSGRLLIASRRIRERHQTARIVDAWLRVFNLP